MAHIFNYQEDPPRVASPWSTPRTSTPRIRSSPGQVPLSIAVDGATEDDDVVVTSLEAEPQEGSTEYKLHLLLRPRRNFTKRTIWGIQSPGIQTSLQVSSQKQQFYSTSSVSRQNRLMQLTTQLLWRLEQSTSGNEHNNAVSASIVSQINPAGPLPERTTPLPSVASSMGALYEIGVADDGTFVGLAEDELTESLDTLRAMAASLGCTVTVLRKVAIGECEWADPDSAELAPHTLKSLLYVAEAYVRPIRGPRVELPNPTKDENRTFGKDDGEIHQHQQSSPTAQLRVTITGATMAGKTSLLGTLTTSTLDDGRGKSRLSLLKHQHEIISGMTSSVTHEILGYSSLQENSDRLKIVNLASTYVGTWPDIHSHAQGGRIVLLTDSAGHPRYRRTTVRGLIGWAPHWTLLCIPADNLDDTTGQPGSTPPPHETLKVTDTDIDLSQEHLELCLKLDLPLVILFTKKDLATRAGLSRALQKVFTLIKGAGRQPLVIQQAEDKWDPDMSTVSVTDLEFVRGKFSGLNIKTVPKFVPIIFTSSLQGAGIRTLHALLHELPIPSPSKDANTLENGALLDVEDVFRQQNVGNSLEPSLILGGVVRHGQFRVGDSVYLGPFSSSTRQSSPRPSAFAPHSLPESFPDRSLRRPSASGPTKEWVTARISSIRNLRVSCHSLNTDQVGTLCLNFVEEEDSVLINSVRKGMVVSTIPRVAKRSFVAEFSRKDVNPLSIGSNVVVYINSIRTSAKIVAGAISFPTDHRTYNTTSGAVEEELMFAFGDEENIPRRRPSTHGANQEGEEVDENLLVTFQFMSTKEYVEEGSCVLVMPGGGFGVYGGFGRGEKGVAGLAGFVGRVLGQDTGNGD